MTVDDRDARIVVVDQRDQPLQHRRLDQRHVAGDDDIQIGRAGGEPGGDAGERALILDRIVNGGRGA